MVECLPTMAGLRCALRVGGSVARVDESHLVTGEMREHSGLGREMVCLESHMKLACGFTQRIPPDSQIVNTSPNIGDPPSSYPKK